MRNHIIPTFPTTAVTPMTIPVALDTTIPTPIPCREDVAFIDGDKRLNGVVGLDGPAFTVFLHTFYISNSSITSTVISFCNKDNV